MVTWFLKPHLSCKVVYNGVHPSNDQTILNSLRTLKKITICVLKLEDIMDVLLFILCHRLTSLICVALSILTSAAYVIQFKVSMFKKIYTLKV